MFVIDEKTGNIHVTKPLDREEKDEYRLIATATDSQTERALEPSSQFIIRVQDINDNPPVFEDGPYSATVSEMANIGNCTGPGVRDLIGHPLNSSLSLEFAASRLIYTGVHCARLLTRSACWYSLVVM